jgi:hypothetical protein
MATTDTATQPGLDALSDPTTLSQQMPGMQQPVAQQPEQIPPYKPAPATPIAPEARPGSFGWKLANTLKGFTAAMGDAGSVGQVPEGAGALYGIQKTLQASAQRQKEEQAHKEVLEQQARENSREDWRMMANVAQANAQMRHEQALTWQLGEEQIDKSVAAGSQMAEQWSSLPKAQSQVLAENLTAGEINNLMQQKGPDGKPKLDPTKSTAFPTGKKYVGEDAQGRPQYALTYSIMSIPAEYKLTPADKSWVDVVNKIPGGQHYNVGDDKTDGDRMPGYVANSLYQQAQTILAQTAARNKLAADQAFESEYVNFDTTGQWAKYLSAQKGDIKSAVDHMMADWRKDPKMQQQFPQLLKDIQRSYATKADPEGTTGYTNALKEQEKDAEDKRREDERETHDAEMERITEQNKKLEAEKNNKYEGDPSLLEKYQQTSDPLEKIKIKQAYRASFPPNEMASIDSMGTGRANAGRMGILMRSPAGSNLADAVNFFYPDFDGSKVDGYAEAVKSAEAGKDNVRLRSAGIAADHLWRMYQDTNLWSRGGQLTEVGKARTTTFNQLATELAAFNAQSNAPGQKEIEDAKQTLGGDSFFSMNREVALKRVADLMSDGINEYKQRWKDAAPSPAYEAKFPDLSPEAYAAFELVKNDGKVTIHDSQGRPYSFTTVAQLAQYMQAKMAIEKQQGAK